MEINKIICGDALTELKKLPDNSIDCCVTSPPYYRLRDYNIDGQIGLEETPAMYVHKLVNIFSEVRRVLKTQGTIWLNLGDSYAGSMRGEGGTYELSKKQNSNRGSHFGKDKGEKHKFNCGCKPKDLIGIPWMVAFALRDSGWWLRQDIIWHKPSPMPESVTDRCTKSHEYIFLLAKSQRYYYDADAIMEIATGYDGRKDTLFKGGKKYKGFNQQTMLSRGYERWRFKNLQYDGQKPDTLHLRGAEGMPEPQYPVRNKRSVWTVNAKPFKEAHFATFPEELIVDMIKAGCPENGIVLDPFMGAGTTAVVARKLNRNYLGIELNPEYIKITERRLYIELGMFKDS